MHVRSRRVTSLSLFLPAQLASSSPLSQVPRNLPPGCQAVRCAYTTTSGVAGSVVLGGPPTVMQHPGLVQHALRWARGDRGCASSMAAMRGRISAQQRGTYILIACALLLRPTSIRDTRKTHLKPLYVAVCHPPLNPQVPPLLTIPVLCRMTLVTDSVSLQFRLPPPGLALPTPRSSLAVAGGVPVVDTVAATSVWAVEVLRALSRVSTRRTRWCPTPPHTPAVHTCALLSPLALGVLSGVLRCIASWPPAPVMSLCCLVVTLLGCGSAARGRTRITGACWRWVWRRWAAPRTAR